ncbi:hypothetical protein C8J57DRAFT_1732271 [Mycena rebaudengoi]|nr:hypothetical protein C8J57DRAFT_1732271 [Mycena rebaudengoi]
MSTAAQPELCQFCSFSPSCVLPNEAHSIHLQELLRSNFPPSSPDLSHFRHIISSVPFELSRYEDQISRIQNRLNSLLLERDVLRDYAAKCGSLFSPIRHVPNELLAEIFAMCSQPSEIADGTPKDELCRLGKQDLMRLSQVCSHWNQVVMNTPMLWSNIVVDFDLWLNSPAPPAILFRLLASSLRRGGDFPMEISVYAGDDAQQQQWGLDLLSQHSHRWRQISLQLDLSFLRYLSPVRERLPLLEKLKIDGWSKWPENLDIFAVAPRLEAATLSLDGTSSLLLPNLLPWEQLMDVQFRRLAATDLPHVLLLLARLPRGAKLELDMDVYGTPFVGDLPTVVSKISSLRVMLDTANLTTVAGQIIQSLTLPHARELSFVSRSSSPPHLWHQGYFENFAARSLLKDRLKVLELKCLAITDVDLLQCVSELPLLQRLSLSDSPRQLYSTSLPLLQRLSLSDSPRQLYSSSSDRILLTDNLFCQLTLRPNTALIPDLQSFSMISLFQFRAQAYLDFVRSRLVPGRAPFAANIGWFPGCKPDSPPDLSELISEGAVTSLFFEAA